ncbi:tyrosine-protein phosphatase [Alkalibacillus almallahensis]|uniref:tyrosine-protein phosphatase n=1 Tax=Alkalibacillus almallahensis TaxID=1379154 RepID=UPI00142151B9|nr:CpsB/CapC family capsule biosynthesis tyrosine phosphatase [Alkalibacillus almallahensis]NIK11805.1 protein-tyrosine phosphatase [Alkalibacillus almallahensis]
MIDIHSHILPGVDDGAESTADSIAMAKVAQSEGINTIYATPHHLNGRYDTEPKVIEEKVHNLNEEFKKLNINLTVLEGQEIRINGEVHEDLQNGSAISLGNQSIYTLIEFPSSHIPQFSKYTIYDLQRDGYLPIIAHPERNAGISNHPNTLYRLVKRGALSQLTAASVAGHFGKKIQKLCFKLIEANLVHFIASDAHNTDSRGFFMEEAFDVIEKRYGYGLVEQFKENAHAVMTNEMVIADPPVEIKKKGLLNIF